MHPEIMPPIVFFGHPLTARGAPITVAIGGRRIVWHAPTGLWLATVELVPRGLRSALIRRISSHDERSRIVIFFFLGDFFSKKKVVVIRDLFVVSRDKKNHDSRQKNHES